MDGGASQEQRRERSRARQRLKWTALGLAGLMVAAVAGAGGLYWYLNSRIRTTAKNAGSNVPRPTADEKGRKPLNVLLIGSDTRAGDGNTEYGLREHKDGLADTTILLHLSADRSNATLVSIPRDTMVRVPDCRVDGKFYRGSGTGVVAFNETLLRGGPPCTVTTVDHMLGVEIDHYVMIDFKGVKDLTNAVDGVPVCLVDPIDDPVRPNQGGGTGLRLPAGPNTLKGEQALNFLRARHAYGDGSDLARIEVQKQFLMALVRKVKSTASLTNVDGMFRVARVATGALTVDKGLGSIDRLIGLGNEIKKVPEKRMAFTTLPNEPWPGNPGRRVQPREPDAGRLWEAVRTDTALTRADGSSAAPATTAAPPSPAPGPTVDPATVEVAVRNGSGVQNRSRQVADLLEERGFTVTARTGTLDGTRAATSSITYPEGKRAEALALATAAGLPETAVRLGTTADGTTLEFVVGQDFSVPGATPDPSSPRASTAPPTPPSADSLQQRTADQAGCIRTRTA